MYYYYSVRWSKYLTQQANAILLGGEGTVHSPQFCDTKGDFFKKRKSAMRLFGFPVLSRGAGVMVHADETVGRQSLLPGKTLPLLLLASAAHGMATAACAPAGRHAPATPYHLVRLIRAGRGRGRQHMPASERAKGEASMRRAAGLAWPGCSLLHQPEKARGEKPHTP